MTDHDNVSSSTYGLPEAQDDFLGILRKMSSGTKHEEVHNEFLSWIQWNWINDCKPPVKPNERADDTLKSIAMDIRNRLPVEATFPSENIRFPLQTEDPTYDPLHTIHVDEFLYDSDHLDELSEFGQVDRNYCVRCGSHKTKPLTIISHSASQERLAYIFQVLLPPLDGKTVLDVGSRSGAVLYGAYVYSKAERIIGVEMNEDWCQLQKEIINKYNFKDRISVVKADIITQGDLLSTADVVVLNNVFQFFLEPDQQGNVWRFLKQTVKKGTYLITIPSLETALATIQTGFEVSHWVEEMTPYNINSDAAVNCDEKDFSEVKCYKVL